MAKARRKSTPIDEKTFGELSEAELNELNERMQRAFQKDLQDRPEYWARARAEAAELAKARKTLDRMMAIEAGLIAPPWVDKLIGQLKSKPERAGFLQPRSWRTKFFHYRELPRRLYQRLTL